MANYKQILHNLKVFERLHEVTKSIKLVAFTKFKKIQYRLKVNNDSLVSISKLCSALNESIPEIHINRYLLVPITSDKGCCGSVNTHLLSVFDDQMHSLLKNNKYAEIFLVGKKGKVFTKYNFKTHYVKHVYDVFSHSLSFLSTLKINEEMHKLVYDKCTFLFNHFKNINEQKIYMFEILSFDNFVKKIYYSANSLLVDSSFWSILYLKYLINPVVLNDLYAFILSIVLLHSLLDHEISELGGRITSMEKSSQNALEMYSGLQIQYNKARQSYITNQLIEICSASAAITVM